MRNRGRRVQMARPGPIRVRKPLVLRPGLPHAPYKPLHRSAVRPRGAKPSFLQRNVITDDVWPFVRDDVIPPAIAYTLGRYYTGVSTASRVLQKGIKYGRRFI